METDQRNKTCEERIDQELQSRLEEFLPDVGAWSAEQCRDYLKSERREIPRGAKIEDLRCAVQDAIRESAGEALLSCEKILNFRLCLSWGGPADYFELDWSLDSACWTGGRYVFQDWFDGATRPITSGQTERLAELFGIYPEG